MKDHAYYMKLALQQARIARTHGEVPAGCVIIRASDSEDGPAGQILGRAHNQVEQLRDATAHAEMIALTQAAEAIGDWRLTDTILYVTKEPCPMCAGAIVLARVPTVVYSASDPRRGGESVFGILNSQALNHRCTLFPGICADEGRELLQGFFRQQREHTDRPPFSQEPAPGGDSCCATST